MCSSRIRREQGETVDKNILDETTRIVTAFARTAFSAELVSLSG